MFLFVLFVFVFVLFLSSFFFGYSALKVLPLDFDPIPKNVLQDYGLPTLYDVSITICFEAFSFSSVYMLLYMSRLTATY